MNDNLESGHETTQTDNYDNLEYGELVAMAVSVGVKGNLPADQMIAGLREYDASVAEANKAPKDTPPESPPVEAPAPPELKSDRPPADPDAHRPVAPASEVDLEPAEVLPALSDKKFDEFTKFIESRFGKEGRAYGMVIKSMKQAVTELDRICKKKSEQKSND